LFLPWARAVSVQQNRVYRFAGCELDLHERRLLAHGEPVTLTPKVFDTLALLVERAGHAVSKDELMAALWPRGFVHESNLTKHIWLIRRALGDDGGESRFIETVPKLGYRFTAPVDIAVESAAVTAAMAVQSMEVEPAPPASGQPLATPSKASLRHHGMHRRGLALGGLIAVCLTIAGLAAYRILLAPHAARDLPAATLDPDAVAIADFSNLSRNDKDAWLGPALSEMLATEIAVGGRLHAMPDELVRPARADLPAPNTGGYALASLRTLQRRLGARYVLSGAYLVSGTGDAPQLRIDLAVQDTRSGAAVAALSRSGAVTELPQLIARTGAALRHSFGEQLAAPEELQRVANAQPPSAEVARRVGFALDALHQYDPARARDELLQAVAQAPGYAPAYMYLAQAWSALGYRAKALAASRQALASAQDLPQESYLQIEAQQFALQADYGQAAATWQKLSNLRPQNPDYRLQRIDAQINAGKPGDAEASLNALRGLSIDAGDPRLELAAARIASARDDRPKELAHVRRALQQAQARGETELITHVQLQLGIALGQDAQAEPLLRRTAADFRRDGNPRGEAQAWQNLGNLQFGKNQVAAARETYQRAMAIYQDTGDLGGVAAIYDDLARMLWSAGDRDGAETATRQSLKIARETADLARQAWNLTALATMLSDESASDAVAAMYQQAIALDRQAGERAHLVFALSSYADLLRMRGDLVRARDICEQAVLAAALLHDPAQSTSAGFECAQIALDRGEVDAAAASMRSIVKDAIAAHDGFDAANAQLVLGQIAMGRQDWAQARDLLQQSLHGWTASDEPAGQAVSEALLALCHADLGNQAASERAAAHARELRSRTNQRGEVLLLDIALAELQGETGDRRAAVTALQVLADDAGNRQWLGMEFETRLAALRLQQRGGDPAVTKTVYDALATSARGRGFGWVLQRMAGMR
jgi:DNA-binding winged helix-turn-helix (wHTH) protein/tetratricopeptide (TPR) repeat protein